MNEQKANWNNCLTLFFNGPHLEGPAFILDIFTFLLPHTNISV